MTDLGPMGGDLLGRRYRLIDRVGAGGMSVVWRARDEVLDRLVAVKWLGSELADRALYQNLVRREAWATARIKHPAVANVYDYGEVRTELGARAFVVMEMLDGESLSDRLLRGPLPWQEAVTICAEVADALATAHENGVVHRDISPDNVMLTSAGVRVFDFGIAAGIGEPDDDATGSTFGTPAYVAPERLDGQPAQTATDVYSLGVMLFEVLTGDAPFPEDTWNSSAPLTPRAAPRPSVPGLPRGVARICQCCLSHNAADRPSARDVAEELRRYGRAWWPGRVAVAGTAAAVLVAAVAVLLAWSPVGPGTPQAAPVTNEIGSTSHPGNPSTSVPPPPASHGATPGPLPSTSDRPVVENYSNPPTTAPGSSPPSSPSTPSVTSTPITESQAFSDLKNTIATIGLPSDLALDFTNVTVNTQNTINTTPANGPAAVKQLQQHVIQRSTDPRMNQNQTNRLLAAVNEVNTAMGYPPLS
jgi:serine/threonine-protein kinase